MNIVHIIIGLFLLFKYDLLEVMILVIILMNLYMIIFLIQIMVLHMIINIILLLNIKYFKFIYVFIVLRHNLLNYIWKNVIN